MGRDTLRKGGIRIDAPHFVAGGEFKDGVMVHPIAPIIYYMKGWSVDAVIRYCDKKKWAFEVFND